MTKTALITGSGQGVGEGIARALASYGASVCLVGRTLSKVEAVAEDINQQGGSAIAIECDVKSNESINDSIEGKISRNKAIISDIKEITNVLSERYGADSVESFFGDTADRDRQDIVARFQDRESNLRFFVGNPRTGGYGLTLTASNTVVYYSNSYDLEIRLQSEDRAHRISQTKKVTYIDLISDGTIDEFIVKNLRGKINLATKVLGEDLKKWLI